jgi:hypothetical protein
MLLHRLFDNRLQIADGTIESLVAQHVSEYFRLLDVPPAEQDRKRREFTESWPYAPHLLRLLEEQVLIATDAQETRDMIRILANLYKSRGEAVPVLTAADFRLDDDASGIGALLDSVSNEHHRTLREKAQHNIISVTEAVYDHANLAPHLQEIVGALWLRSIAVGNLAGPIPPRCRWTSLATSLWMAMLSRSSWQRLSRTASTSIRMARAGLSRGRKPSRQIDGLRPQRQAVHRWLRSGTVGQTGSLCHRRQR